MRPLLAITLGLLSFYLSFCHGWDSLQFEQHPASVTLLTELGITRRFIPLLGAITLAAGLLLCWPSTFFAANVLNAVSILGIMALALRVGNYQLALREVPFLLLPLLLLYLGYPFQKQ
jgi:hypothetical protein